jgi:hypothetical protein
MNRQFDIHRIEERQDSIDEATKGMFPIPEEYQQLSEQLDVQVSEIQLHCESRCRMIHRPEYDFLPEVSLWHKRQQMFKRLIRVREGKVKNPGVVHKQAQKLGIDAPAMWSIDDCYHGVIVSKAWKRKLGKYAPS